MDVQIGTMLLASLLVGLAIGVHLWERRRLSRARSAKNGPSLVQVAAARRIVAAATRHQAAKMRPGTQLWAMRGLYRGDLTALADVARGGNEGPDPD